MDFEKYRGRDVEVTRSELESLGFNVLLENNLIEIVGRKDAVGKPLLFGTTDNFLKKFDLTALSDLPDYDELLERIKVLHTKNDDTSLFNFTDYKAEIEKEEAEKQAQELSDEELEQLEDEILNAKVEMEVAVEIDTAEEPDYLKFLDETN